MEFLTYALQAGKVQRYHTIPNQSRAQSVAEHVHRLLHVASYLFDYNMPQNVMVKIMLHDLEEYQTGDMPYEFKRSTPEAKAICAQAEADMLSRSGHNLLPLSTEEEAIIKWADMSEMALYALDYLHQHEYAQVAENVLSWLQATNPPNDRCIELHGHIINLYGERCNEPKP